MQCVLCGLLLVVLVVIGALISSLAGFVIGIVSLAACRPDRIAGKQLTRQASAGLALVGGVVFLMLGYGVWQFGRSVPWLNVTTMDDEALKPFLDAMEKVDRASLGFTPIPPDARVEIEWATWRDAGYDVMLHIYADTSRTVAFRREGDGSYRWIHEQEIHTGPRQYATADAGRVYERIAITYETEPVSGAPLNMLFITYSGEDPRLRLKSSFDLTLEDVLPILEEWRSVPTPMPRSVLPQC